MQYAQCLQRHVIISTILLLLIAFVSLGDEDSGRLPDSVLHDDSQLAAEGTKVEWSCEQSTGEAANMVVKATPILRPAEAEEEALDDFEVRENKALKGYDIAVRGDVRSVEACAKACQDHLGHVTCRSFMFNPSKSSCRLRHVNEFSGGSPAGVISGISLPRRSYLTVKNKTAAGGVVARYQARSFTHCTDICARAHCGSYVYKDAMCELKDGTTLETGASPGYVSGLKKSSELRGRKVRALYILPKGEQPKPNAEDAIAAILKEVQEHYLIRLGVTFELAADGLVTRVNSPFTPATAVKWGTNMDFVISTLPDAYLAHEDVVVTIIEGTEGAAGGSSGIAKITGTFWNPSYALFQNGQAENSPLLGVWSHELGHAFGLRHLRTRECLEARYDLDSPKTPGILTLSCIMKKSVDLDTLYDLPFSSNEIQALLDPEYDDPYHQLPFWNEVNGRKRPHPSTYLGKWNGPLRTSLGSEKKCLALPEKIGDGTDVHLGSCGMDGWAWTILPDGHIRSTEDPGKCLDAEGPSFTPGTTVQVWSCIAAQPNQLWTVDKKAGTITPQGSPEVCVEAGGTAGGGSAKIRLAKCDGSAAQRWSFQRPIVLRSGLGSKEKCLNLMSLRGDVQLFHYYGKLNQKWILSVDGRIHNGQFYDLCLQTEDGSYGGGTAVRAAACAPNRPDQLWTFDQNRGVIRHGAAQDRCVDVSGGVDANRRKIQLWECNYSPAQRWAVY